MTTWLLPAAQDARMERQNFRIPGTDGGEVSLYEGKSAFGNAAPLTVQMSPSNEQLVGKTYVYRGGIDYQTTDPVIRQLWLDSGFTVTVLIP